MKYSRVWLLNELANGKSFKYLFFWGHHPKKDGSISQSCLSQWWYQPFSEGGKTYATAEHWMMAKKASLFNDVLVDDILAAKSPAEAKKFGRSISHFDQNIWDQNKYDIVVQGNLHKFQQNPLLKAYLLNTKDRVLVEASPVDDIWGVGLAAEDTDVTNPEKWKGPNLLGFALMEVRSLLK